MLLDLKCLKQQYCWIPCEKDTLKMEENGRKAVVIEMWPK